MKVIVATTFEPFRPGGGDLISDWLNVMLQRAGHDVELFRFPFAPRYKEMLDQMLALRLMDISERGDRLIAIRTPSYLIRHPSKVLWFIHHIRVAYDLWGTPYGGMPDTAEALRYREAIRNADNVAFSEAHAIYTNSRVVSKRLKDFNRAESTPLFPPLLDPERYQPGPYGDTAICLGRIVTHKRQALAVAALRYTRTPVRLTLMGPCGDEDYLQQIRGIAAHDGTTDRLTILADWVPEEAKLQAIAGCLCGMYIAFDEDSYGYATLEFQHAEKAVICTTDSNGPLELISDGINGLVCEPTPRAIARALDRLYDDRREAERMGLAGPRAIEALNISWDRVLELLLA